MRIPRWVAAITFLIVLFFGFGCGNSRKADASKESAYSGTISISGAFALYPLAVKWSEAYQKLHPDVKIDVSAGGAGKGITDVLSDMVDIGMVSREIRPEETAKGAYGIIVARDAVVPTMNNANIFSQALKMKGLKRSDFEHLYLSGATTTWGMLSGMTSKEKVAVFTRSDACGAAEIWGKYIGKDQEALKGVGVYGDPGMADAVKKDPWSLGYNNIVYAYDAKTRKPFAHIAVIPLDINENGKIDPEEDFYGTLDQMMDAIKTGKYPAPPSRSLYFVTKSKPSNPVIVAFLQWVITEGQKVTREAGFVEISSENQAAVNAKLK